MRVDFVFVGAVLLSALPANIVAQSDVTIVPVLSRDRADAWVLDGSGTWVIRDGVLALVETGRPEGAIRRPAALALLKRSSFRDVTVEAEVRSTADPSLAIADVLLVFGYRSPTRFYYVHLSGKTDAVHNGIFHVNEASRRRIDDGNGAPQLSDRNWHEVRLDVDGESGRIEVFLDDSETPGLSATVGTVRPGLIGFGSFDDTVEIRSVTVVGTTPG
jgi:hypothetical protein